MKSKKLCKNNKNISSMNLGSVTRFGLLLLVFAIAFTSSSCTYTNSNRKNSLDSADRCNNFNILCAGFAEYDWLSNLTEDADNVSVSLLFKNGVDLHSFQPTADDIIKISRSDLFVFGGGESAASIEDILKTSATDVSTFNCMEALGDLRLIEDHSVAVQQARFHTHNHSHEYEHEHEDNHEDEDEHVHLHENNEITYEGSDKYSDTDMLHTDAEEYDEHFWLSPKRSEVLCLKLTVLLSDMNPENSEIYAKNSANYCLKLQQLDKKYTDIVSNAPDDTLIFADRFPFLYLATDYNIKCHAAFSGCSAETSASFETIISLANILKESKINTLLIVDNSDTKTADTVIRTSGRQDIRVVTLNSMQSVTTNELNSGISYLSVMEDNLRIIAESLNSKYEQN